MRWRTESYPLGRIDAMPTRDRLTLHLFATVKSKPETSLCGEAQDTDSVLTWCGTWGPGYKKCAKCKAMHKRKKSR